MKPPMEWPAEIEEQVERMWARALTTFKKFSPVVFYSSERFWERHGFVQQSLAYALAKAGVEVIWLDGSGWRKYQPEVVPHPNLSVFQLFQLPLRRFQIVNQLSLQWQADKIESILRRGPAPFFWIFGGMEEALVEKIAAPQIYSVFDNPYSNLPDGSLCRRARWIICQNQFAANLFGAAQKDKVRILRPPMELPLEVPGQEPLPKLPKDFPKKVLGYVGSFLADGLDFDFVEQTLIQFPDWGVMLAGRTDERGEEKIRRLSRFSNFARLPWVPRSEAVGYWQHIDIAFFPYAEAMGQDGAFAVKTLEALYFGKPVIATQVPKTADLPLIQFADDIAALAPLLARWEKERSEISKEEFWKLALAMDPRAHLAQVAELVS